MKCHLRMRERRFWLSTLVAGLVLSDSTVLTVPIKLESGTTDVSLAGANAVCGLDELDGQLPNLRTIEEGVKSKMEVSQVSLKGALELYRALVAALKLPEKTCMALVSAAKAKEILSACENVLGQASSLDLRKTGIGSDGAGALAEVLTRPGCRITELNLYWNNLGAE